MNEVNSNTLAVATAAARASSLGNSGKTSGDSGATPAGKVAPEQSPIVSQKSSEPVVPEEPIENVVAKMNDYFQNEQRNLEFNVDEEAGLTVISVVDRESGDLIRQIPEDIFLRLAKQAKEHEPIQLISVQG